MLPPRPVLLLAAAAYAVAGSPPASAQHIARIEWPLIGEVMPAADRFEDVSGEPPVVRGYAPGPDGVETLVGYVFLTSDLPPEQYGYSGPIEALVGMTLDGTLTGVRVVDYRESYRSQMGDFLRRRGFQEQFSGKYIGDPFRVWGDVDGISRVSISVRALARGVRDSARKVAAAYSGDGSVELPTTAVTDVVGLSWFELRRTGVVERFEVTEPGEGSAGISLSYIGSDRAGEYLFGRQLYERALRAMQRRDGADHLVMYGVDGSRLRLFLREGWSVVQGSDTLAIDPTDVVMLGLPSGGVVSGEVTMVGIMLVRGELDIREPFRFVYDLGDLGVHSVEYTTQDARMLMAEAAAEAEVARRAAAEAAAERSGGGEESSSAAASDAPGAPAEAAASTDPARDRAPGDSAASPGAAPSGDRSETAGGVGAVDGVGTEATAGPATSTSAVAPPAAATASPTASEAETGPMAPGPGAAAPVAPVPQLDFTFSEEETLLERTLADTSWSRVATMLLVLAMATWAFVSKSRAVRWASLAVTVVVLGFVDGGFLSVSHITSGIWAGAGVYLRDVPLLLIASFTVVTTLVWGRVFCGFLCPFGALQDFVERAVPARLQRELPQAIHDRAVYVKYGILALIVVPAVVGSQVSLYQYFEPFGTVFFLSSSLLFWAIAGAFLLASAVVPRFYCRYACPLGAALALGSLVSPRRIARVEQCDLCKVCEQRCPTGAIRGPDIDFVECVRCNECEIALIEQRGVCRHDMEDIRPRLVQLRVRGVGVGDG